MRRLHTACSVVGLASVIGAANPHSLLTQQLQERDLRVAGLRYNADTAAVRRALGTPRPGEPYRDPDGQLLVPWRYPGLTVTFDTTGQGYRWELSGPQFATARGVKPGDFTSRVRATYGQPSLEFPSNILYALRPEDRASTLGIDFFVEAGVVRTVSVGRAIAVWRRDRPANPLPN